MVVHPDQRHVVGHLKTGAAQRAHRAERDLVREGEDRRRGMGQREQRAHPDGPTLDAPPNRHDEVLVHRNAGLLERRSEALLAADVGRVVGAFRIDARDHADLPMPEGEKMVHGLPPDDLVDNTHRRPIRRDDAYHDRVHVHRVKTLPLVVSEGKRDHDDGVDLSPSRQLLEEPGPRHTVRDRVKHHVDAMVGEHTRRSGDHARIEPLVDRRRHETHSTGTPAAEL